MINWYNIYSFWTAIMCILAWAQIIQFSVIPSVIGVIIGTLAFLYLKIHLGRPMSPLFILVQVTLHLFPFLVLPVKFTQNDVLINMSIFLVYNLWLMAQGQTFNSVYKEILYEDARFLTFGDYLQSRGL